MRARVLGSAEIHEIADGATVGPHCDERAESASEQGEEFGSIHASAPLAAARLFPSLMLFRHAAGVRLI